MDPLDRRLTDAGITWRESQSEPPDLDRMVVALRQRRSGRLRGRLMYAFVTSLLLAAALAVAPTVGSLLSQFETTPAVTTPSPVPAPSQGHPSPDASPASPRPSTSPSPSASPSDRAVAADLVDRYEAALVAGDWQTAFDLLAATSPTHEMGNDAFASERAPFFASVGGRYTVGEPARVTDWTEYAPVTSGADRARAWLIEVDYPNLSGNNAGFEQCVVAPDPTGTWKIWPVR